MRGMLLGTVHVAIADTARRYVPRHRDFETQRLVEKYQMMNLLLPYLIQLAYRPFRNDAGLFHSVILLLGIKQHV